MSAMMRATPFVRFLRLLLGAGAALAVFWAAPARADYRDSVPVLRIGLVDARVAAVDPAKLDAVGAAFSTALGVPVEIVRMGSYAALIDAHASGRVGYAIHSTRSYAATDAVCGCVRAFRTPVAADGSTGFRSVLVVRDGVNAPIADLRIAYSREDSVSGFVIPQQAMATGGLARPQLIRAGSVSAVMAMYAGGEIDGFFAWVPDRPGDAASDPAQVFGGWNATGLQAADPLRMLWSSQRIPYGPHAVHRSLPDDLVEALGAFLDDMPKTAPGLLDLFEPVYGGGYVTPDPEDFRNVRSLVAPLATTDRAALQER